MSSDKILHKNLTRLSANMSPLYQLGTPNHKHSVQYLFLISVGNTGPMMSSDYNCFWMAEQQSPFAFFKVLSLTCWCKVQLEFSKTWGAKWKMEEKYLRCTLCHKLKKKIYTEKKKPQIYQCTLLKSVFFFLISESSLMWIKSSSWVTAVNSVFLKYIYIYIFAT